MSLTRFLPVPIGVSARHVHLSEEHVRVLFGKPLTEYRALSQKGEFAAEERVTLVSRDSVIQGVRILGPPRRQTQVEISRTDAVHLRMDVPVRLSGNLEGTPGITLVGSAGSVTLDSGVIIAARHLHVPHMTAAQYHLSSNLRVEALVGDTRQTAFKNIIVRIASTAVLELHLDTDEANAADIRSGTVAQIVLPDERDTEIAKKQFLCVDDIKEIIQSGRTLKLLPGQKLTPAAREFARSRKVGF